MNILITGGASGLGEAIVRMFAEDKHNFVYFTYSKSKENAEKISQEFKNSHPIKCDFANNDDLSKLTESIAKFDLDVLINNAYSGSFLKTHFHKIASEEFLNDFKENVISVIKITQSVINEFRKKKQGKIITILTSALSEKAPIGSSIYMANKAYLENLTKIWGIENERFNITSNSVSPSFMQTSLTASIDERLVEQIKENNPLRRILTVEEVAKTVLSLVHASSDVNGVNTVVH